jgi:hypothetical protein
VIVGLMVWDSMSVLDWLSWLAWAAVIFMIAGRVHRRRKNA